MLNERNFHSIKLTGTLHFDCHSLLSKRCTLNFRSSRSSCLFQRWRPIFFITKLPDKIIITICLLCLVSWFRCTEHLQCSLLLRSCCRTTCTLSTTPGWRWIGHFLTLRKSICQWPVLCFLSCCLLALAICLLRLFSIHATLGLPSPVVIIAGNKWKLKKQSKTTVPKNMAVSIPNARVQYVCKSFVIGQWPLSDDVQKYKALNNVELIQMLRILCYLQKQSMVNLPDTQ